MEAAAGSWRCAASEAAKRMNESIDEVKSGVFAWFLALMDSSSSSHGLTSAVYEWGRWKDEYDGPEQGSSSSSSSSFARANVGIRQLTTLSDKHVSMVACGLSHSVALSGTRARVSARQRRPPSTVKLTLTIRARTHRVWGRVHVGLGWWSRERDVSGLADAHQALHADQGAAQRARQAHLRIGPTHSRPCRYSLAPSRPPPMAISFS